MTARTLNAICACAIKLGFLPWQRWRKLILLAVFSVCASDAALTPVFGPLLEQFCASLQVNASRPPSSHLAHPSHCAIALSQRRQSPFSLAPMRSAAVLVIHHCLGYSPLTDVSTPNFRPSTETELKTTQNNLNCLRPISQLTRPTPVEQFTFLSEEKHRLHDACKVSRNEAAE